VVDLAAHSVEHQQAAGVSRLDRMLCDQPARKLVFEVVGPHACALSPAMAGTGTV
jgi:hypothetical protein